MKKNQKEISAKKKFEKEVSECTEVFIEAPPQHLHSLKIRGRDVEISCSNIAGWITLTPVQDISRDLRFCPHCGQRIAAEVFYGNMSALMPQGSCPTTG